MDLVEQFLGDRASEAIQGLVSQAGFSPEQAQGFLPVVLRKVLELMRGGGTDMGSLLGGNLSSLLSKLDAGEIATGAQVGEVQAKAGLEALAPTLLAALGERSGGLDGLLSSIGGDQAGGLLGAATGLAGKLFK